MKFEDKSRTTLATNMAKNMPNMIWPIMNKKRENMRKTMKNAKMLKNTMTEKTRIYKGIGVMTSRAVILSHRKERA